MPAVSVSSEMPGNFARQRLGFVDRIQREAAALGDLLIGLVPHGPGGMDDGDHRAKAAAGANSLSSVAPCGAIWIFAASGLSAGMSRMLRTKASDDFVLGEDGDLLLLELGERLDLLVAGAEQQHEIVLEDRERARPQRHLGVGAQDGEIGLPAIELRERLGIVCVVDDLDPETRGIVLQQCGELGANSASSLLGVADGKGQRLRIVQPGAAAPDGGERQQQGQHDDTAGPAADWS